MGVYDTNTHTFFLVGVRNRGIRRRIHYTSTLITAREKKHDEKNTRKNSLSRSLVDKWKNYTITLIIILDCVCTAPSSVLYMYIGANYVLRATATRIQRRKRTKKKRLQRLRKTSPYKTWRKNRARTHTKPERRSCAANRRTVSRWERERRTTHKSSSTENEKKYTLKIRRVFKMEKNHTHMHTNERRAHHHSYTRSEQRTTTLCT